MLKPLADAWSKLMGREQQPPERPYDLSGDDMAALKKLVTSSNWKTLLHLLDNLSAQQAEILLGTQDPYQLQYMRGYVKALRDFPLLVGGLLRQKDSKPRQRNPDAHRAKLAALYGTAAWPRDK